jgi:hypothetical protein
VLPGTVVSCLPEKTLGRQRQMCVKCECEGEGRKKNSNK